MSTLVTEQLILNPLVRPWVIAVANQKGGVGKTTSAVNLATCLAELGLPVIFIDLDPQVNGTDGLGITVAKTSPTVYEVLDPERENRVSIASALVRSEYGPAVLAGTKAMAAIELNGNGHGGEVSLAEAIAGAPGPAVYVIDCPPNLGRLTKMALVAAGLNKGEGEAFVPVSPGPNQIKGLYELLTTITELKKNGQAPHLALGSLLATNYDGRNTVSRQSRRHLEKKFEPEYLGTIRNTVKVDEAAARFLPLCVYDPAATASEDYREIAREYAIRKGLVRVA